ncbi:MAG TPA: hypothetical protein PLM53_03995 [Spirochaetota bacterium]|nr:hypothetical protein [Spirochaetota bacterium]HPC40187.1 hypothetical protein [Spirochaetota bacterium]HPL16167.1 hypothetical protein [Spirochaetota bacterium]HQF07339.1 hypothetical protein [Spirochaetota bacterium]HQH96240.1 hypothetical protein [Spirochaetota bacterium]
MSVHKQNEQLVEAIQGKAIAETISCAAVFTIVDELKIEPIEAGRTLDLMDIAIIKCQLGLFGFSPEKKIVKAAGSVSEEMNREISARLKDGRLSCADAWEIAKKLKAPKMDVSAACEKLGIKIKPCQLGAF